MQASAVQRPLGREAAIRESEGVRLGRGAPVERRGDQVRAHGVGFGRVAAGFGDVDLAARGPGAVNGRLGHHPKSWWLVVALSSSRADLGGQRTR